MCVLNVCLLLVCLADLKNWVSYATKPYQAFGNDEK